MRWLISLAAALCLLSSAPATFAAEPAARIPLLIDTDIGADIDDAFALALAVASPEVELVGVTTVGGGNEFDPYVGQRKDRDDHRAWIVCRFLTQVGHPPIAVAAGADPQPKLPIDWQIQYRRHPAAIYNRTFKPVQESAVELMTKLLSERDDLTMVTLGPLTNVARLIKEKPEAAKKIKRLVVMGGSIRAGYDGKPMPEAEWNIKSDIAAAKEVFAFGLPITLVPLDATATVQLTKPLREELFAAHTPLTWQVQNLFELHGNETPVLFDAVALTAVLHEKPFVFRDVRVTVTDDGFTKPQRGNTNSSVALQVNRDDVLRWYVDRVKAHGQQSLPPPPGNVSQLIDAGKFPTRVHTFEDYDTEIEKRWWMCGKVAGGGRTGLTTPFCEGVLTQDFDDKQGQTKTMYRAVIFNPVPGPPMGPNTRLKFQYRLSGTDTLRIQLYSLSNGYHRYLSLKGLEQNKWLEGCVDMTEMRRPDGSGGPLSENERIDDIQFYVDPRAELWIDNIILYDAAPIEEKQPFPQRIIFTGWFDTGKQGKEWPGEFDVVDHAKPRAWKYAQSRTVNGGGQELWVSLRGLRKLDKTSEMTFLVKSPSSVPIRVEFLSPSARKLEPFEIRSEAVNEWNDVKVQIKPPQDYEITGIRFTTTGKEPFGIDDLLLYTPGE